MKIRLSILIVAGLAVGCGSIMDHSLIGVWRSENSRGVEFLTIRRGGDPLLDALRELVRCANPTPRGARGVRSAIQTSLVVDMASALFGGYEDK